MKTEHMLLVGGGVIVLAFLIYVYMQEKKLQKPGDPPARFPFNLILGGGLTPGEEAEQAAMYAGYY